ncbi:type I restriction-modification system subunit M [Deefgea piscis]|uniref:type I restriction-modification system subunit M n=1 Tax=Deefgea piscis TaxID=2739061 RepID=UPI001C813BB6|nr:type I restriction-modification system subunit M [Deefgea piscis]QZA82566.1 type I restriction-modification system subunit M [Deefgea piscis]
MAIKKSELYSSLWKSCDELRGGMDASQYKDYILVLLFVKYVSDKYAGQRDSLIEIPTGGSFADMVALKGDKEIGEKINIIIAALAEANELKGVIDVADFNDPDKLGKGKDMVERLSNLISIFDNPNLNFASNRAEGDDILGDAYEFLMRQFSIQSGKSKGQFYTPAEVSRIMAKVLNLSEATSGDQTIYDPTCGSGSLLLKAHDEAKGAKGLDLALYGQEMDNATSALAKMNMILHDCPTAEIWQDNTLSTPYFKEQSGQLKRHDFIVANPPFSTKAWSNGFNPAEDEFGRFEYGVPPEKNGDYAFLLHMLASLKSTGKAAVILPHGVLFRGGAEGRIRQEIVSRGYIKGIIGLPANLFYGTGIPACIIVLDKEHAAARKGIFMVDASKGFVKDGNKHRLREQDIHKIVDTFTKLAETEQYARLVPLAEIAANDYNLNLPRYIDTSEAEDLQDIAAHLRGGIPQRDLDAMKSYWQVFPSIQNQLMATSQYPGYYDLKVAIADIKPTIFSHPEFIAFNDAAHATFRQWQSSAAQQLKAITPGITHPKTLNDTLAEQLLAAFEKTPLIQPYDVYQHLMDYWAQSMQDDVYLVAADGWQALSDGKPNLDLLPKDLIIARYFAAEAAQITELESTRDAAAQAREEFEEEHAGDDGLLVEAKTEKGKLSAKSVKDRLKVIAHDTTAKEEIAALKRWTQLADAETAASKQVKDAEKALDTLVMAQYRRISQLDVCDIVVDDKWLVAIETAIQSELDRVSQTLTGRVRQLAERYATPLPTLLDEVESLSTKVDAHLQQMGFTWN